MVLFHCAFICFSIYDLSDICNVMFNVVAKLNILYVFGFQGVCCDCTEVIWKFKARFISFPC